jgi:hypothetical protein
VLAVSHKTDWDGYSDAPISRPEFSLGRNFVRANGPDAFRLFKLASFACVPFSIVGAVVTWYWARTLYGALAGIVALVLWVFCPNILAYGQQITPDVGATSLGLLACFLFWRWLRDPGWGKVPLLGIAFGLAQLTKFTWVILFGLWPLIWGIWTFRQATARDDGEIRSRVRLPATRWVAAIAGLNQEVVFRLPWRQMRSEALQLAACFLIGVYLINLCYGFSGALTRLGDYEFVSRALGGSIEPRSPGNRFRGTVLEHVPVPLPRDYVAGIDSQKSDFDRGMRSYLRGQWRDDRGWWYYYLYGLAIKVPLGTWVVVLLATALTLRDATRKSGPVHWEEGVGCRVSGVGVEEGVGCQVSDVGLNGEKGVGCQVSGVGERDGEGQTPVVGWRDEMVLLVPAFAILVLVSSQTGFSHHLRYVLPCLPFVYIWASKVARAVELKVWPIAALGAMGVAWSVGSSLWIYPHSLSYFNELVGGPKGGHWHLGSSNIDWGQDLLLIKRWYDAHPEARPFHLAYEVPLIPPELAGIKWEKVPSGPVMNRPGAPKTRNWPWPDDSEIRRPESEENPAGPAPGWFAVGINKLHLPDTNYEYFLEFEPVDMVGYSTYIYHITLSEANHVRKKLGLPELTCDENQAATKSTKTHEEEVN